MTDAPIVFILSWERPIFLWATLDSLYRNTKMPVRFVLVDNNSKDPLVHSVIRGFEKRDMFHEVLLCQDNDPDRMNQVFKRYRKEIGEYFFYVENDVTVPETMCWATEYTRIYNKFPGTAMIGTFSEQGDFIDPELIRRKQPELTDEQVTFYSKSKSPERLVDPDPSTEIWPHDSPNPPGRLMLLRKKAVDKVGVLTDSQMAIAVKKQGLSYKICTTFQHRHLSLLNWFDVEDPGYADSRAGFFGVWEEAAIKKNLPFKKRLKMRLKSLRKK